MGLNGTLETAGTSATPGPAPLARRSQVTGALALVPLVLVFFVLEVLLAVSDSLADVHASRHHVTGPLWLGIFALLGLCGPLVSGFAAWHTRAEKKGPWQALLRAELAALLVAFPAALFLFMA